MARLRASIVLVVMILSVVIVHDRTNAADITAKSTVIGVKGGLITGGEFWREEYPYDLETDMSFSFGGYVDHRLGEKITGGLYLDAHNFLVYEESKLLLDMGITIKALLRSKRTRLALKPGIGIGYGMLGDLEPLAKASNYFMLRAGCEAVFSTAGSLSWLGEVCIIGAASGGNDDWDMGFGPMFLIRGGLVF